MRKDNAFLGFKDNPFNAFFNFTDRGDPFLIMPSCNYKGVGHLKKRRQAKKNFTGSNKDLITIPIEHSLLKKIKKIEVVLDEEFSIEGKTQKSESRAELQVRKSQLAQSPDSKESEIVSPTSSKKKEDRVRNSQNPKTMESIAEVAAGPTEDSIFIPKKLETSINEKHASNVNSSISRLEPLALKDNKALEFLEYYYHKIDKTMRKSFGNPT